MADSDRDRALADHQRIFDRVWTQLPAQQNRTSSAWWFFILFPDGETGFGPRQLMFSIAARVGDRIRVNDVWLPGMDVDRDVADGVDEFDAITVGWDGDRDGVEERIVNHPARARLSADGSIEAWAETDEGERRGSAIRSTSTAVTDGGDEFGECEPAGGDSSDSGDEANAEEANDDHDLGLEAEFVGEKGAVAFEAWGDLDSATTSPVQSMDVHTRLGGVDVVAWRQMRFRGEFDLPASDDPESLTGSCYFQRVCFNVPLFPWKWIWAVFPDGSAFSAMIPFLGPHVFRKGYRFFNSLALERLTLPVRDSAFWSSGDGEDVVAFDDVSIEPLFDYGEGDGDDGDGDDGEGEGEGDGDDGEGDGAGDDEDHPDFAVEATTDDGEFVSFTASTYGHARNHIDRPLLGGRVESHWSYNEYLFEMTDLDGRVGGTHISAETMGGGFGTLEYSTGLGF